MALGRPLPGPPRLPVTDHEDQFILDEYDHGYPVDSPLHTHHAEVDHLAQEQAASSGSSKARSLLDQSGNWADGVNAVSSYTYSDHVNEQESFDISDGMESEMHEMKGRSKRRSLRKSNDMNTDENGILFDGHDADEDEGGRAGGEEEEEEEDEEEIEEDEDSFANEKAERPIRPHIRIPTRDQVLNAPPRPRPNKSHARLVFLGLFLLFLLAWGTSELLSIGTRFGHGGPKIQVILMISDGMGPASETLSRTFLQFMHDSKLPGPTSSGVKNQIDTGTNMLNESVWSALGAGFVGKDGLTTGYGITPLDDMLIGASRTRSTNSLVTDSAAGATAFSCGIKTYNGAIGVDPVDKLPCGTVLEAASRQGFMTGLVATSRITHATPASFYAHVVDRDLESEIATFLVGLGPQGQSVDFAFGGGHCFFIPNTTRGSCRTDDQDLIKFAKDKGINVLIGMKELKEWHDEKGHEGDGPVLGLFADDHMDYEIDRRQIQTLANEQPSLREMTVHALQHLQTKSESGKGFFLMIEGSRIDMAAHNNDPIGHLSDMLAYHSTVAYVKKWVDVQNDQGIPTMLISVSDHETGGLALGRQLGSTYPDYLWYPETLVNATQSSSYLGNLVHSRKSQVTSSWLKKEVFENGLGIVDASTKELADVEKASSNAYRVNRLLADAISRRAQVGWSTAGHSGVDVNLYAYGYNNTGIAGNRENTEIGEHIAHAMGLNLEVVTHELKKNLDWHSVTNGNALNRTITLAHYHGDF